MLLNLLSAGVTRDAVITALLSVPAILLALTVHEFAHGYVAYRCGDSTAKAFGRLTLNPSKHLDLMGTLCMLIAGFGWAKPIPVNARYLRKPKRDMVLVSLAGPVSNLLLAFISAFFAVLINWVCFKTGLFYSGNDKLITAMTYVYLLFWLMVIYNIGLALFNFIPIPPLDGSKILAGILPNNLAAKYLQIERNASVIIMAIMFLSLTPVGDYLFMPLTWARGVLTNAFFDLFELIFFGVTL